MTTRSQLRTAIRNQLNDSGGTPLWSDTLLNEWINEAIRAYSRELPEEATATITAVVDQDSYTLPARTWQVLRVEQPTGVVRLLVASARFGRDDPTGFSGSSGTSEHPAYRIFAGSLILDPAPSATGSEEDIRLEYLRSYAEPAADGDALATPAADDEVLILLASGMALSWIGGDEAKRLRYQDRQGLSPGEQGRSYRGRAADALRARRSRLRITTLEVT